MGLFVFGDEMPEKNGEKREYKRDEKGRFVKGTAPGPGRKHRDFKTDFEMAAREIAKALRLGKEPDPVYILLMKKGIQTALKGNYNFWKDLSERLYGKEPEKVEGELKINIINYGDIDNSIQVPAKVVSTANPAKQGEKQSNNNAQEVGEDKDSSEPADSKGAK